MNITKRGPGFLHDAGRTRGNLTFFRTPNGDLLISLNYGDRSFRNFQVYPVTQPRSWRVELDAARSQARVVRAGQRRARA